MKTRILLLAAFVLMVYVLGISVIKESPFQFFDPAMSKGCIPPEFDSNYPRDVEIYITPSPEPTVISEEWERISNIPEYLQGKYATLELVHPQSDYDEFWLFVYADDEEHVNVKDYRPIDYLIYRTDTKQWRKAPTPPSDWNLFLDAKNNVWAISPYEPGPPFYRLDEFTNSFIPMVDATNELTKQEIGSNVQVAPSGLFWFLTSGNNYLMSFDPVTLEAKLHLTGEYYISIAIDKNGNVYLLHVKDEPFVSRDYHTPYVLTKYDPSAGDIESVEIPRTNDEPGGYINLYIDDEDRLWISDFVWIDLVDSEIGKQHSIPRSPIFIHYVDYLTRYVWNRPRISLESVDGRLWYTFEQGAAWFKPDTKEWCWFARGLTSGPVADSENNLWMMLDNSLYELRMSP